MCTAGTLGRAPGGRPARCPRRRKRGSCSAPGIWARETLRGLNSPNKHGLETLTPTFSNNAGPCMIDMVAARPRIPRRWGPAPSRLPRLAARNGRPASSRWVPGKLRLDALEFRTQNAIAQAPSNQAPPPAYPCAPASVAVRRAAAVGVLVGERIESGRSWRRASLNTICRGQRDN